MPYRPTLDSIHFLTSPEGQRWLAEVAAWELTPATELRDLARLRQSLSPDQAAVILEQAQLRRRAHGRFQEADRLLFTRSGLEQATAGPVALHRAHRLARHVQSSISNLQPPISNLQSLLLDLSCGLGGDALAFAYAGLRVLALDRDAIAVRLLVYNAQVLGLQDRIRPLVADSLSPPFGPTGPHFGAIFADPARRTATGERVFHADAYTPPLAALVRRYGSEQLIIKVGPGLDFEALNWPGEIELVSLDGEVKEAVLWGTAFSEPGLTHRATLLPGEHQLTNLDPGPTPPFGPPDRWLIEPDGAVIRAGLIAQLAAQAGLRQFDRQIAYLAADRPVHTPFGRTYPIDEVLPFNLKALNRRLRDLQVGVAVIKKRGLAIDPDDFRRRLKLSGPETRVIFLTRVADAPAMLIGREPK